MFGMVLEKDSCIKNIFFRSFDWFSWSKKATTSVVIYRPKNDFSDIFAFLFSDWGTISSDNFEGFHTFSHSFLPVFLVSAVPIFPKLGGICFASFAKLCFASLLHLLLSVFAVCSRLSVNGSSDVPTFCTYVFAVLQNFVHVANFPACALAGKVF